MALPDFFPPVHPWYWLKHILNKAGMQEQRCAACLDVCMPDDGLPLCPACREAMPARQGGYCSLCGEISLQKYIPPTLCGACLIQCPPWGRFRFHGVFEGPLRDLILRAKYKADMASLNVLGMLLAKACADLPPPDAIIPMPLHQDRLKERGYNQCRELARPLARNLQCPVRPNLLSRTRSTPPQTGLSREKRKQNLARAFQASPEVKGMHILLIDDTATTGTSLRSAATALQQAGVAELDVAVVAHTSLHGPWREKQ